LAICWVQSISESRTGLMFWRAFFFDGLEQKLRGKQLVGFTIAEIKARTAA